MNIRTQAAVFTSVLALTFAFPALAQGSWADRLKGSVPTLPTEPTETETDRTTVPLGAEHETLVAGLKEALAKGTEQAIEAAGTAGGFADNEKIRIPMPGPLDTASSMLRGVGLGRQVDEFERSMNRAAEKAAPQAKEIVLDAIRDMSIEDARGILVGPADGATRFLRRRAGEPIADAFRPIVSDSMQETGVTRAYTELTDQVGTRVPGVAALDDLDLNEYVTREALDGVFTLLAEEERRIRENPAARTTDLLREVFGN
ncbi:MAG: DUF4197 domain-containing protein [Thioalkalivibrio sp.]|nr:MAG: DUF4197 domain-containing protein [Thioalkalivibrio sp.]